MNTAEIFRYAPMYISKRFYAINDYVWKSFFPGDTLNARLYSIPDSKKRNAELARLKDIAGEASLVILVMMLRKFFNEGSEAAKASVDTFKDLGIKGFKIGSQYFSKRNQNVIRGDILADQLMSTITSPELIQLIKESEFPYQIIDRYKAILH